MEGDEEYDTHICLNCHTAIVGLENYVQHKKYQCPARKTEAVSTKSEPLATASTTQELNVLVGPPVDTAVSMPMSMVSSAAFSPTSSRAVDPNMVLCSSTGPRILPDRTDIAATSTTIMDFLSSLELQCRPSPSGQDKGISGEVAERNPMLLSDSDPNKLAMQSPPGHLDTAKTGDSDHTYNLSKAGFNLSFDAFEQEKESIFDSTKAGLKIAHILSDLNFDSDSEGFEMPSDTEGFLDFSDDDYGTYDDDNSPHTGGKWKPGSSAHPPAGHTRGKWRPPGKESPGRASHTGKWHPSMGGKYRPGVIGGKWRQGERPSGSKGKYPGKRGPEDTTTASDDESARDTHKSYAGHAANRGKGKHSGTAAYCTSDDDYSTGGKRMNYTREGLGKGSKFKSIGKREIDYENEAAKSAQEGTDESAGISMASPPTTGGKKWTCLQEKEDDLVLNSQPQPVNNGSDGDVEPNSLCVTEETASENMHTNVQNVTENDSSPNDTSLPLDSDNNGLESFHNMDHSFSEQVGENESADQENGELDQDQENMGEALGDSVEESMEDRTCKSCNRIFINCLSYNRHLTTTLHKKRLSGKGLASAKLLAMKKNIFGKKKKHGRYVMKEYNVQCPLCQKEFNNKYNFARHLLSSYHIRRAKCNIDHFLLDEGMQRLLLRLSPFQCQICGFYCNNVIRLTDHMRTDAHVQRLSALTGPMLCFRCKFQSPDNDSMLQHLESHEHSSCMEESDRPCVIKELRHNLTCSKCPGKIYRSAVALEKHKEVHHAVKPRFGRCGPRKPKNPLACICSHCGKDCRTLYNVAIHIRRKHTKERPYSCTACSISFSDKSTLNLHYKSKKHLRNLIKLSDQTPHQPVVSSPRNKPSHNYKCDHCDFCTPDYRELRPHYLEMHAASIFSCDICGMTFLKEYLYQNHCQGKLHRLKEEEAQKCAEGSLTCNVCGVKFYIKGKYDLHVASHNHPRGLSSHIGTEDLPDIFNPLLEQMKIEKKKMKFKCPQCAKVLKRANMMPHIRLHSKSYPYKCMECGKGFASNSSLYRHLKMHLGIKTFKCEYCGQDFIRQVALQNHMLRHHSEKPQEVDAFCVCSFCGEKFVRNWMLDNHVKRKHENNGKKHKCPYEECGYSFFSNSELQIHIRVHTNERPFLCDECGYGAKTQQGLTRHRRSHTGEKRYACEHCTYRTSFSSGLRRHMRCHIGTKPYKCPFCSYTCNTIENLKKHILNTKSHKGLRMYNCRQCKFGTNSAKEYQDHVVRTHNVSERDIPCVSTYAGIYIQNEDLRKVPEGSQVLQMKEKKPQLKGEGDFEPVKKRKKSKKCGPDFSMVHDESAGSHMLSESLWSEQEVVISSNPASSYGHMMGTNDVKVEEATVVIDHMPMHHVPCSLTPVYHDMAAVQAVSMNYEDATAVSSLLHLAPGSSKMAAHGPVPTYYHSS